MGLLRSLTAQLLIVTLAVAVPMAGLAAYLIVADRNEARAQAAAAVREIARDVAADAAAFLARSEERARYVAARPAVRAMDPQRCDPLIYDMPLMSAAYSGAVLVDLRGRVLCWSFAEDPAGADYADREWFRAAASSASFQVGAPLLGRASAELVVPMTVPVLDAAGALSGILLLGVRTREFSRLVTNRALPGGSALSVVSADGTIIARSLDADYWPGRDAREIPALAAGLAQRDGVSILPGVEGTARLHAFTTMPSTGWLVSAAIPMDAVMAASNERMTQSALATGLVFAAVLAAALGLSARIRRPIRSLAAAAHAVARGEYQTRAAESGPAEIAAVAAEFNRMARTRAAVESDLARRSAELEAANKELEAFAYSVSHDLRAPLRAIDGFSQVLIEDYDARLDDEGRDSLRRVREASQRMAQLIDDMLKLSRATRGELDIGPVDLSRIAEAVVAELRRSAPDREVQTVVTPDIRVLGDRRLLGTAMENLLSNAWKFTARAPAARIEFSAVREAGQIVCCVSDNGAGFDMAYAGNLFAPFQRLHRASDFPGNGIGLATVKRVIARLGGTVRAEGAVGQGARFCFSLPDAA